MRYGNPVAITGALRELADCDAQAVTRRPPTAEGGDAAAQRVRLLAAADTRLLLGDYALAAKTLGELAKQAEDAGNLEQAAGAYRQHGLALELAGDATSGAAALRRAIIVAERGDVVEERVEAYVILARLITRVEGKGKDALSLLQQAAAILERPELTNASARGPYHNARAAALLQTGDPRAALDEARLAEAEYRRRYGDRDQRVARALNQVASAAMQLKEHDTAMVAMTEALELDKALFGETHPHLIGDHINLGGVLLLQQEFDAGLVHMEQAREITLLHYPDGHRALGTIATNIAQVHLWHERYDESLAAYREAARTFDTHNPAKAAKARAGAGASLAGLGRTAEAEAVLRAALAEQTRLAVPGKAIASTQTRLARVLKASAPAEARTLAEQALATLEGLDPVPTDHIADARSVLDTLPR